MNVQDAMKYMIDHPKTRMRVEDRVFMFDGVVLLIGNGEFPLTGYAFYEILMIEEKEIQYPRTVLPIGMYSIEGKE